MNRDSVNWRGYIPALTTPFTSTGELDLDSAQRLYRWVHQQGMHGVIVLGTQGEWFSLSKAEKADLLRLAGAELAGKMTLIAGCNAFSAVEAIQNMRVAADSGFDGILLTAPPYMVPNERELVAFYTAVSDASTLPICVYNWPPGTNIDMSLPLLTKLADLDKVVALKNSTPDIGHFLSVFFALKHSIRIFGIPMSELGMTLVQHHGADGTMGAGAVLGRDHPGFFEALWAGDIERARTLGQRDQAYMRQWFNPDYTGKFGSSQAIFKAALNAQGLPGGYPRLPILPLDDAGQSAVRQTLIELGKLPH